MKKGKKGEDVEEECGWLSSAAATATASVWWWCVGGEIGAILSFGCVGANGLGFSGFEVQAPIGFSF